MKKRKKLLIGIIVVLAIGLSIAGALSQKEKLPEVYTEKVFRADITQEVTGNGRIYPEKEVKISARVPGRIIALNAEEGDSVHAGQVLVRLEQEQYLASLHRAKSNLMGAKANLKLAKSELERTRDLYAKKLVSQAELQSAEARYEQALSQLQQAEAGVKEAEDALAKTVIATPIDGVVIQKNKEVGEIALGSEFQADVILVVADLSQMEARVEVNENDIVNVSLGDTARVEIDAFPDTTFLGVVSEISNSASTRGQGTVEEVTNFEVRIRLLEQVPEFRPGMSATADIATETHRQVLNVPIQAVTVREQETLKEKAGPEKSSKEKTPPSAKKKAELTEVVFVVKNGIAEMRPVKLGLSNDSYYEVLSGVEEGEAVVTGPYKILSRTLKDGQRVKVVEEPRPTLQASE
ncbi:MAG: efflux RND transporter periplasmic adaptor subunit [Calditrichaeota bacterium]|nr:MAG: efflux RND transporter periplasmic adaptor subunit [Calditrichota bacterium]